MSRWKGWKDERVAAAGGLMVSLILVTACSSGGTTGGVGGSAGTSAVGGTGGSSATGGAGGSGGIPLQPIPESEFYTRLADALCQGVASCCVQAGYAPLPPEQCVGMNALYFEEILRVESNVEFDPGQAAQCVAAVSAGAANCKWAEAWPQLISECRNIYVGKLAPGEPCTFSDECADPPEGQGDCGMTDTCIHLYRGKLNDPCTGTCSPNVSEVCAVEGSPVSAALCWYQDGLQCSPASYRCEPVRQVGESCVVHPTFPQCTEGLACLGSSVCGTLPGPGQPCDAQGSGLYCADGSLCEDNSALCTSELPDGAACTHAIYCQGGGCLNGVCTSNTLASETSCG